MEQNQDKSNLLSTIKEKFKFGLQELKQKSETYKEDILNVIQSYSIIPIKVFLQKGKI